MNLLTGRQGRRGVAGIFATLIMFLLIFTVGLSFLLYSVNLSREYAIAQANNSQLVQTKGSESLSLGSTCSGNTITVSLKNTGGVPVQIADAYVSDSAGALYPSGGVLYPPTDGLPISINPGATSPVVLSGVDVGCNPRNVGLVTSRGNVFTITFPSASGVLTLNPTYGAQGSSVSVAVTGSGFTPHQTVVFSTNPTGLISSTSSCTTDASGAINASSSCTITTSSTANPGAYQVTATAGTSSGSSTFTVTGGPSLTTFLSPPVLTPGASTRDTAQLSGVTPTASGSIIFYYGSTCPTGMTQTTNGGLPESFTVNGPGTYGPSSSVTFLAAGTYYWEAIYSGDASNPRLVSSCEPLSVVTFTVSSTTTLAANPTFGPLGTIVTLTGNGYGLGATALTFDGNTVPCTTAVSGATCSGGALTATSSNWVATIVVPTTGGGVHIIQATQNSGTLGAFTLFNVSPSPTLALNPSQVLASTRVTIGLSGANYANTYTYSYCLSSSSSVVACIGPSSPASFTSTGAGAIPSSTSLTNVNQLAGIYYMVVYDPVTKAIASSAALTVSPASVPCNPSIEVCLASSSSGLGFLSLDFNSFHAYNVTVAGSCTTGFCTCATPISSPSTACQLTYYKTGGQAGGAKFSVKNAPIGYTLQSPRSSTLAFSVNITNTDPAERTLILDQNSLLYYFALVASSGFKAASFNIAIVNSQGQVSCASSAAASVGCVPATGFVVPAPACQGGVCTANSITIFFLPGASGCTIGGTGGGACSTSGGVPFAGTFYLHGIIGYKCTSLTGAGCLADPITPTLPPIMGIGQNEPTFVTLFGSSQPTLPASVVQNSNPATDSCTNTASATCAVTLSGAVTDGDALILAIGTNVGSTSCVTVSSITDSLGNTLLAGPSNSAIGASSCSAAFVFDTVSIVSGASDTFTVTFSGTPSKAVVVAYEVKDAYLSPNSVSGSCTSACPTTLTTSSSLPYSPGTFILAIGSEFGTGQISSGPAGFTSTYTPPHAEYVGYQIPVAGGSNTFSMVSTVSPSTWAELVVVFP